MNWSSWAEFWAMGGYGVYVWGSFGMTAALLCAEPLLIGARRRALRRSAGFDAEGGRGHEA